MIRRGGNGLDSLNNGLLPQPYTAALSVLHPSGHDDWFFFFKNQLNTMIGDLWDYLSVFLAGNSRVEVCGQDHLPRRIHFRAFQLPADAEQFLQV